MTSSPETLPVDRPDPTRRLPEASVDASSPDARPTDGDIPSLTAARGAAAVWVVAMHLSAILAVLLPEISFLQPLFAAGGYAVPLFFILSGYVLGLRYVNRFRTLAVGTVLRFWWLRLGRVYPVHLFTLMICLAIVARRGWPADEAHSPASFAANCLLVHAWDRDLQLSWNYPSWSISSEWFAYLVFPAAAAAAARAGRKSAALFVATACAASAGVYAFEDRLPFQGLVVVVPTFLGGIGLSILCPPARFPSRRHSQLVFGLVAAVVALPFVVETGRIRGAAYLVVLFLLVAALGAAGRRIGVSRFSRVPNYIGEISYSLYMTHATTITLAAHFLSFDVLRSATFAVRVIAVLLTSAAIFGTAAATYYAVERPLRTLSRRSRLGAAEDRSSVDSPNDQADLSRSFG